MNFTVATALAASLAMPVAANAAGFEALVIGNGAANGSHFYMLSLRQDLHFGGTSTVQGTERNALSGLRLRFDASQSTYNTNYDATPGTGTGTTYRLLLSYGIAVDADTTLTVTGGVSHKGVSVSPVTLHSPADKSKTAEFYSLDLEYSPGTFGSLQALAEHDGAAANYVSASYLVNLGPNLRMGPTANYVIQGDYSRSAWGASVIYDLGDKFELKATAANAAQKIGSNPSVGVDYVELQLRTSF